MASHLLHLLVFLTVGMVELSHGALSPELYWKSVLPKTVMPKSIRDDLQGKSTKWVATNPNLETSVLANPRNINLYFLEQDLKKGKIMTLDSTTSPSTKTAKFLPRQEAEKLPFSSEKLPDILKHFSVKPGSVEARTIENTLKVLGQPTNKGQATFVATSLESMIDFAESKIEVEAGVGGVEAEVEADSTETEVEVEVGGTEIEVEIPIGLFSILSQASKIVSPDSKAVACQKQKYPYAVFSCHGLANTRAYMVPLEGPNGMKVKALAMCHVDTSQWNPNHSAFKMLKVGPGTTPVCQFLSKDHVVFVRKN